MKQVRLIFLLNILLLTSCEQKRKIETPTLNKVYAAITNETDTLFSSPIGKHEYGLPCAYIKRNGDTVIPAGTFEMCFTDTFANYAYVYDKNRYGEMVAINRKLEVVFDVFLFDNTPDEISEGVFRIMRNGKIGYADAAGNVIIEPKYECAYPFENGKAKVAVQCEISKDDLDHTNWESEHWSYIDKGGDVIK